MLQATLRDWHVLSTAAPVPWLREVIDRSLPPDANDDEVVAVDVLVNTSPVSVSPDVLADWVVDRARAAAHGVQPSDAQWGPENSILVKHSGALPTPAAAMWSQPHGVPNGYCPHRSTRVG